ncbi:MAG: peptide deformylase [Desulfovibrionaceae bacterium]|nr:peptide deformylase [Desulfovibrionaceae bacterium]
MILPILYYPDPLLEQKSEPVTEITDEIRQLAQDMTETMYKADGIGLAAPQIGRLIRMVVIDITGPEKREDLRILINPELTPVESEGFVEGEEGCLSVRDYRSNVVRYAKVLYKALDLNGKEISGEAEGLLSVCLQHETDHLDGKVFLDRISRLKRRLYTEKLKKRLAGRTGGRR